MQPPTLFERSISRRTGNDKADLCKGGGNNQAENTLTQISQKTESRIVSDPIQDYRNGDGFYPVSPDTRQVSYENVPFLLEQPSLPLSGIVSAFRWSQQDLPRKLSGTADGSPAGVYA